MLYELHYHFLLPVARHRHEPENNITIKLNYCLCGILYCLLLNYTSLVATQGHYTSVLKRGEGKEFRCIYLDR